MYLAFGAPLWALPGEPEGAARTSLCVGILMSALKLYLRS